MAKKKAARKNAPAKVATPEPKDVAEVEDMPVAEMEVDPSGAWDQMTSADAVELPPAEQVKLPDPPEMAIPRFEDVRAQAESPEADKTTLTSASVARGQGVERMLRDSCMKPTDVLRVYVNRESLISGVAEIANRIGVNVRGYTVKPNQVNDVCVRRAV